MKSPGSRKYKKKHWRGDSQLSSLIILKLSFRKINNNNKQ